MCRLFRDYLTEKGFVEIHTPKIISGGGVGMGRGKVGGEVRRGERERRGEAGRGGESGEKREEKKEVESHMVTTRWLMKSSRNALHG